MTKKILNKESVFKDLKLHAKTLALQKCKSLS